MEPIKSKREPGFGGLYGGDRLQFGGGKVTDTGGKRNPELCKVKKLEEEN